MTRTRPKAQDLTPAEFKAIREKLGLTPQQFALEMGIEGQGGSRKGMRPFGNETGRTSCQPSSDETGGGIFYV